MDFHQSASERFAEKLFEFVIKEFDGKIINSDDCNLELLMKKLPRDLDEDIELIDHIQNNNIVENDDVENEPEVFQDNIDSPKNNKKEKKKKNKKSSENDNEDKPKKKPNAYIIFKKHPDNQDAINKKAEDIDPDTNKKLGKVKAAGQLWRELSQAEQDEWKNK